MLKFPVRSLASLSEYMTVPVVVVVKVSCMMTTTPRPPLRVVRHVVVPVFSPVLTYT